MATRLRKSRRKTKPRYVVNVSMNAWDIAKAGAAITLKVTDRNGLIGTVEIGQGTFGWKPAHGKTGFRRLSWRRLADVLGSA